MSRLAIIFGLLLIAVGVVGYLPSRAPTALIPSYVGAALTICGLIGTKPGARKHAMHAAAAVALLGGLGSGIKLITGLMKSGPHNSHAIASQAITAGLCALFVVLCVRSFIAARKAREAAGAGFETMPPRS